MATLPEYAALSAIVYNDVRKDENVLSPLPGWTEILADTGGLGFTAGAYKTKGNKRGQRRILFERQAHAVM